MRKAILAMLLLPMLALFATAQTCPLGTRVTEISGSGTNAGGAVREPAGFNFSFGTGNVGIEETLTCSDGSMQTEHVSLSVQGSTAPTTFLRFNDENGGHSYFQSPIGLPDGALCPTGQYSCTLVLSTANSKESGPFTIAVRNTRGSTWAIESYSWDFKLQ